MITQEQQDLLIVIDNYFAELVPFLKENKALNFSDEAQELRDSLYVSFFAEKEEDEESDDYDESMDGDHESALVSVGWGTNEDYGYFESED